MGRQVRDARLETREARARLKARKKPYWRLLVEGRHLGYYKGAQGGKWLARVYQGEGKYLERVLGLADDHLDANGSDILSYAQVHALAVDFGDGEEAGGSKPYTVADAIANYLAWYKAHKKPNAYRQTEIKVRAFILPALGNRLVAELTTQDIRQWLESLITQPPRSRTGQFSKGQNHRESADPRARRATANRILTVLKAALNHVWHDGKIESDDAWRRVKPFHNVEAPKIHYLSEAECLRLINACTSDFRLLVRGALLTGCRYGELTSMVASDFHPEAGTVLVRESKNGKPRHVPLTEEGNRFFEGMTAGQPGDALIFTRQDGKPWGQSHQQRPLKRACAIAGISPTVSFHGLRHTYGSLLAMRGVSLQVIAEALGHSDTRITSKHYAHLMPSYVADTIRAHLPNFGATESKVVAIR
jgi:Site-specific recombinase XerD